MSKPMTIEQQIERVEIEYSNWREDVAAGGYAGCKDDPTIHARFKAKIEELKKQLPRKN